MYAGIPQAINYLKNSSMTEPRKIIFIATIFFSEKILPIDNKSLPRPSVFLHCILHNVYSCAIFDDGQKLENDLLLYSTGSNRNQFYDSTRK